MYMCWCAPVGAVQVYSLRQAVLVCLCELCTESCTAEVTSELAYAYTIFYVQLCSCAEHIGGLCRAFLGCVKSTSVGVCWTSHPVLAGSNTPVRPRFQMCTSVLAFVSQQQGIISATIPQQSAVLNRFGSFLGALCLFGQICVTQTTSI